MDHAIRLILVLMLTALAALWLRRAARAGRIPDPGSWDTTGERFALTFSRRRGLALGLALILLLWAAVDGLTLPALTSTDFIALCWLAGVTIGLAALAGPAGLRTFGGELCRSWGADRAEWRFVAGLTLVALALRVVGLGRFPVFLTVDEENFWNMARLVVYPGRVSPFATGWAQHPFLIATLQGYAMRLLGEGTFSLRLPSALLGTLHIPALYVLARLLYGRRVGRWSALALTFLVAHLMFSRYGLNQVGDALMTLLALIGLLRAWRGGRAMDYVLFGAALGMGQLFYAAGLFSLVLIAVFVVYLAVRQPDLIYRQADGFVLAMAAFALVVLPYYAYLLAHHLPLLPRSDLYLLDRIGIQIYLDILDRSPAEFLGVMALSLRDVYTAYVATFDQGRYAFAALPLLGLVGVPLFVLGALAALRRWREPRYGLPLAYLLLIPLPTLLATPIPDYFRYVLAMPFGALMIGLGVGVLADGLGVRLSRRRTVALVAAALAVEVGAHAAAWHIPWATLGRYDAIYRDIAAQMAAQPDGTHYYLIFEPDFQPFWSAVLRTAMGERLGQFDYLQWADQVPPRHYCDTPYIFFVGPGRAAEVEKLAARYRDATVQTFTDADGAFRYARLDWIDPCATARRHNPRSA